MLTPGPPLASVHFEQPSTSCSPLAQAFSPPDLHSGPSLSWNTSPCEELPFSNHLKPSCAFLGAFVLHPTSYISQPHSRHNLMKLLI